MGHLPVHTNCWDSSLDCAQDRTLTCDCSSCFACCLQVVYDLQRMTRMRRLPLPLHSVSEDGARGLAVNMQRLDAASPGLRDML